ncbi:MAG: bifunctional folylpolyglutamate synthase/dihydrofolate synthase [Polyangiaceae bacterium]
MASLTDALSKLHERIPLGMRLGLGPIEDACGRFGHPERSFAAVHVAGTNGKGSVCAMVDSIARAHGLKVGLYTSPHLGRFAERIRIGGEPIEDAVLAEILLRVLDAGPDLSFFEVATLAAFLVFRAAQVELAVVEVGLGGRLDATNVIPLPAAAAITRIALDHTDRLGPTLVDIAREKAGIAKTGLRIVLGPMSRDVRSAIDDVARAHGAKTLDADGPDTRALLIGRPLPLAGVHQIENAWVACRLAKLIGLSDVEIVRGLSAVQWPGRLERIDRPDGSYLIDAAHNPDGIEALARHVESLPNRAGGVLVFGALADKDWGAMLDRLIHLFPVRVYVMPQGRAAAALEDLVARHSGEQAITAARACERARELAGPDGLVVVAGSIFLAGEARAFLLGSPFEKPVAL